MRHLLATLLSVLLLGQLLGACGWFRTDDAQDATVHTGRMPDLRGWDLNDLGDGDNGILYELHELIGIQSTRYVANESEPAGVVVDQNPAPGSPLDDVNDWSLTVSAGGPVVSFWDLPPALRRLAETLDGYDRSEPVLVLQTESGTVYKTDAWVLSEECVGDPAYRLTPDSDYRWACPDDTGRS